MSFGGEGVGGRWQGAEGGGGNATMITCFFMLSERRFLETAVGRFFPYAVYVRTSSSFFGGVERRICFRNLIGLNKYLLALLTLFIPGTGYDLRTVRVPGAWCMFDAAAQMLYWHH